jgi:uncharacterized protein (UPF0218 family)
VWLVNFVESIEIKSPSPINSVDTTPSIMDIGLQIVLGVLDKITSRNQKRSRKTADFSPSESVNPTPIQVRLWPALLNSFEMKARAEISDALNVVGLAPTGTGKTMLYVVPVISHCC